MNIGTKRKFSLLTALLLLFFPPLFGHDPAIASAASSSAAQSSIGKLSPAEKEIYDQYIQFFEKVYDTIDKNYYFPVTREGFNRFIDWFNEKIYAKSEERDKKSNYINWRSAAYLVDFLKDPEDTFSTFFPPKDAKKFEQKALGQKVDLGIEGKLVSLGYEITHVEPRADAYVKGLKPKDIIVTINNKRVLDSTENDIVAMLTPLIDTKVLISYIDHVDTQEKQVELTSMEYIKQSVFMVPVPVPGVFCLEVRTFNRMTAEDMLRFLAVIDRQGESCLIIDLRGNPGGPPLAAREISAFFLPPGEPLAYFQKKNQPKAILSAPEIPEKYRYKGPVAILVNEKSGSSSELFSGFMQRLGRATLIGTNTAGKVMLKSMFDFDDGSMLLLVTARGYFSDGVVYSFKGVVPNQKVEDKSIDLIRYAALYLKSLKNK